MATKKQVTAKVTPKTIVKPSKPPRVTIASLKEEINVLKDSIEYLNGQFKVKEEIIQEQVEQLHQNDRDLEALKFKHKLEMEASSASYVILEQQLKKYENASLFSLIANRWFGCL